MIESVCCVICKSEMQLSKWKELMMNVCFCKFDTVIATMFQMFSHDVLFVAGEEQKKKSILSLSVFDKGASIT